MMTQENSFKMAPLDMGIAILVMIFWGVHGVIMKIGLKDVSPYFFMTERVLFGLLPMIFFIKRPKEVSFKFICAFGIVRDVIQIPFLVMSLKYGMPAGLMPLIYQTQVFFTALLAALILKEQVKIYQVLGMCVSLGGLAVIGTDANGSVTLVGFLMVISAAIGLAITNIMTKRVPKETKMLNLMVWVNLPALAPLIGLTFLVDGTAQTLNSIEHFSWMALAASCVSGWGSSLLAYTLWSNLLKNYPASLVSPYTLLMPLFGLLGAALILGERFYLTTLIGAGIVILGLFINQFFTKVKEYRNRRKTMTHLPS